MAKSLGSAGIGRDGGRRADLVKTAVSVGLACLAFDSLVQLENYLLYAAGGVSHWLISALFLVRFPFILLEHVVVAAVVGALYFAVYRSSLLRWVYFFWLCAFNLLVLLDQICYRLFLDHAQLSLAEGAVSDANGLAGLLVDSVLVDLDWIVYANLVVWGFLALLLFRLLIARDRLVPTLRLATGRTAVNRGLVYGVLPYSLLSLLLIVFNDNYNLDRHVLVSLFSPGKPRMVPQVASDLSDRQLYRPYLGAFEEGPSAQAALKEARRRLAARGQTPHIVFVVLESVGSRQLFKPGFPLETYAPFLAAMVERGVLFDAIYGTFPGTTRSHIPMLTGGRTITWGRVGDEVKHRYTGPTLVDQLKKMGYRSGLFSAQGLRFENLDAFYRELPYDEQAYYGDRDQSFQPGQEIHSWGVKEEVVREKAVRWIDQVNATGDPFFLHFHNIATHHPYAVPEGYAGPAPGTDAWSRYLNALHYTDSVLEDLYDDLEARGLSDRTLWVVCGDHGQAFARTHANNYAHKNALYEENIRNFLLLSKGEGVNPPLRSGRLGGFGDIMPTLLDLIGGEGVEVPGQNLLAPDYEMRIAYFHKSTHPERWGLRDGRWKYSARHDGSDARLFDLQEDPDEQVNLARKYPERLRKYRKLCSIWYTRTNYQYIDYLPDFRLVGGKGIDRSDLGAHGPKVISFGQFSPADDFIEMEVFGPDQQVVVWNRWVPYTEDKAIRYQVDGPGGSDDSFEFTVKSAWDVTHVNLGSGAGRQAGRWHVSLWDGDKRLIEGNFMVGVKAGPGL
jgi:arylsulfatase A-like enzyme